MPGRSDFAFLEVDGYRLGVWTEYSVSSDLLTPADAFSFRVTIGGPRTRSNVARWRELVELLEPGRAVKLYVGDDVTGRNRDSYLQLTGIIDERHSDATRDGGTSLQVNGRDLAAHLVDNSVPLDLVKREETIFLDLVREAVEPYGIRVSADSSAARDILTGASRDDIERARQAGIVADRYSRRLQERADRLGRSIEELAYSTPLEDPLAGVPTPLRDTTPISLEQVERARARAQRMYANALSQGQIQKLTIQEAKPQPGETIWEFLDRHARRLKLMMWMSPKGELILSSPNYGSRPRQRLVRRYIEDPEDRNNILSGTVTRNDADRYSAVKVYGRAPRHAIERAKVQATAIDPDWSASFERTLIVHDNSIKTADEALKRAERELALHRANRLVMNYVAADHGADGYLYAVDTLIQVDDEVAGVRGPFYVVARTFDKSRDHGTLSRLRLLPPGAIVL